MRPNIETNEQQENLSAEEINQYVNKLVDAQYQSSLDNLKLGEKPLYNPEYPRKDDVPAPTPEQVKKILGQITSGQLEEINKMGNPTLQLIPITSMARYVEALNSYKPMEGQEDALIKDWYKVVFKRADTRDSVKDNTISDWRIAVTEGSKEPKIPDWDDVNKRSGGRETQFKQKFGEKGITGVDLKRMFLLMMESLKNGEPINNCIQEGGTRTFVNEESGTGNYVPEVYWNDSYSRFDLTASGNVSSPDLRFRISIVPKANIPYKWDNYNYSFSSSSSNTSRPILQSKLPTPQNTNDTPDPPSDDLRQDHLEDKREGLNMTLGSPLQESTIKESQSNIFNKISKAVKSIFTKKQEESIKKIRSYVSQEKEPGLKIWGGVSNPEEHDPKKFRYLVHAFNLLSTISQPLIAISAKLSGAYKVDKREDDQQQAINLFDQPERLDERVSLSMSLIDQEHTETWGEGGIIVEAPQENIVITAATDFGSHNSSKDFLRRDGQDQLRLSGEQLLQSTFDGIYNEVVAFAKSESGETVRLKGFFIKVDKRGQPIDSVIAEKMEQHARRLNLPLIEIQVKGPYEQEMLDITENSVWAHYKGNRYNLSSDDPEVAFFACDDKYNTFFSSPTQIEEVVTHFVKRGNLNQAQAQQIREKHKIADTERKSPKVEYDPKTKEISSVIIKDGYGKDAIEYWLKPSGYCWRINMEELKKAHEKMSLNPQRMSDSDFRV